MVHGVFDRLWAAGRFLSEANGLHGEPLFEPCIAAAGPGPLQLVTGVSVIPQRTVDEVARTDILFVPNVMLGGAQSLRSLGGRASFERASR
jgi:hypothetical protein